MSQTQIIPEKSNLSDSDSVFLKTLRGEAVDRTPVWLMRQAGRYMPEYRRIRKEANDFIKMCENPQLACDITMLPIKQFDLDAAIIFSDILLIGQAMGADLSFVPGKGPIFEPVRTRAQVDALLGVEAAEKLGFVGDAIGRTVAELGNTPLIGFCGSPWTVATYMVEGGSSKQFDVIKQMAWSAPETLHVLLEKLAQASLVYLKSQVQAGASALMIFDTWGGILPFHAFEEFSMGYMQKIIAGLKSDPATQNTPVIVFSKGANTVLPALSKIGADALSVDWSVNLGWARQFVPQEIILQGNLDPTLLLGSPEQLRAGIQAVLESYGPKPGHIFNLGHGILPQTDPEQVKRLVAWVREISQTIKNS
tara:strand:- start:56808 stop:57902 length:1095 start_codon:yes stop_codon:yes gene_type:complete